MRIIFNSSMPRSGSELLQVLAHQNPNIYSSSTSPLLEYQFGARSNFGLPEVKSQNPQLMKSAFIEMCSHMAQGYYEPLTNRPIVMDKNRGWLHYFEWVDQWNPSPKMVCMVRDLRSVIASFEKVYRKTRHTPEGPDSPAELRNITFPQRIEYWLNTQPVGLALNRLFDCFQRNVSRQILFLRYEDLCNRPQETMNKFYDFMEVTPYEHDFKNIHKQVEEDDSHFGVFGNHSIHSEIKAPSDWRDTMSDQASDMIVESRRWFFETFNYEV